MLRIQDIVSPIRLLPGHHSDTARTGQGCFLDVISYLSGHRRITDQPRCVCVTVRTVAAWLNDNLNDEFRVELLPYIERAMNSATTSKKVLLQRTWRAVQMANEMLDLVDGQDILGECRHLALMADYSAWKGRHSFDAEAAVTAVNYTLGAASAALELGADDEPIFAAGFRFLDDVLPPLRPDAKPDEAKLARAQELVSLQARQLVADAEADQQCNRLLLDLGLLVPVEVDTVS